MAIAYSAEDARRIVLADKLAIVLGVESEYAFGAEDRVFDPVNRLTRYHDMGVRTFYAAHKINSRLSGADIYYPKDSQEGKAIRVTQAISGCFYYDDNVAPFPLKNASGHNFCENDCGKNYFKGDKLFGLSDNCVSRFGEFSETNMADYVLLRGADEFNGFSIYPKTSGFSGPGGSRMDGTVERNNLGLSVDGKRVMREAMARGMLVNIDHVSSEARKELFELATKWGGYPLNAFHNNPNSMLVGSAGPVATPFPHEYDMDDSELEFIRATGGFFGVRLGPLASKEYPASGVTSRCPRTATENARVLAYLSDLGLSLGYSLDFSTVTQGVHSRTLAGCGEALGPDEIHTYEGEVAEGLSHIGTIKYFHRELEAVGLKDSYRRKLRDDGVAAFIDMWQRSEWLAELKGSP